MTAICLCVALTNGSAFTECIGEPLTAPWLQRGFLLFENHMNCFIFVELFKKGISHPAGAKPQNVSGKAKEKA